LLFFFSASVKGRLWRAKTKGVLLQLSYAFEE